MIRTYSIHNFKNHADSTLELGNLSILTGINGAGKSSVLQTMLLLRESFSKNPQMQQLFLDGVSFRIGRSNDLINPAVKADFDKLRISVKSDDDELMFSYKYPLDFKNSNGLACDDTFMTYNPQRLLELSLFNDNFQYLSAFRVGPQDSYESNTNVVDAHRQLSYRMGMGEYAVYFLNKYTREDIPIPALSYLPDMPLDLGIQAQAWMNEISNGIQFNIVEDGGTYTIRYGYSRAGKTVFYRSAYNTGYGVSYVLSIIVAVLSAKTGSLLLIENPEAHIHPSGQSALMRLISLAAENGVQIILETHSDHIINGALVSYKKNHFDVNNLKIYYFDRDEDLNANPILLKIGDDGIIKGAPVGFFDQMEMDLEVLYDL